MDTGSFGTSSAVTGKLGYTRRLKEGRGDRKGMYDRKGSIQGLVKELLGI